MKSKLSDAETGEARRVARLPIRVDPRQVRVLELIAADPGCTPPDIAAKLGIADVTARACAYRLIGRGAVEHVGLGPYRPMRLIPTVEGMLALENAPRG